MRKRNSIRDMFSRTRTCASIRIGNAMSLRIRHRMLVSVRTRMARLYIGWVTLSIRFSIRIRMISRRPHVVNRSVGMFVFLRFSMRIRIIRRMRIRNVFVCVFILLEERVFVM